MTRPVRNLSGRHSAWSGQGRLAVALAAAMILLFVGSPVYGSDSSAVFGPVPMPDFNIADHAVARDQQGFMYLAGPASSGKDVTSGSYDTTYNGGESDVFIAKFAPQSAQPIAVTLIGGIGNERCRAMIIDQRGYIVLTGSTNSPDFGVEGGAKAKKILKEPVAFVARFDTDLKHLQAVNLLGPGRGLALAQSLDGRLYVAGEAMPQPDLQTPEPGRNTTYNGGGSDAFAARLDERLNIISKTLIGGTGRELGLTMTTLKSGDVIVAGFTDSEDFPVSDKVFGKAPINRSGNGFITRFSPDLKTLQASVQLGGSNHDIIHALALGQDGSLYVTGLTLSSDFPATSGSYDESLNGDADIFVSKISANLDQLSASTFLGGSMRDWAFSIVADDKHNISIAGDTESSDFPNLSGIGSKTRKEGAADIVVVTLNGELTAIERATRLGGNANERVPTMAQGLNQKEVIAGLTNSKDFPAGVPDTLSKGDKTYRLFITYITDAPAFNQP